MDISENRAGEFGSLHGTVPNETERDGYLLLSILYIYYNIGQYRTVDYSLYRMVKEGVTR